MKYLPDLKSDVLLFVTPTGCDGVVMEHGEFLQSDYYKNKENVEIAMAEPVCVRFDLHYALEFFGDEMYEDWLDAVKDDIPKEVKKRIEQEVNSYLDKFPTYYPGEAVDW